MGDVHYYCPPADEMNPFQSSIVESYYPNLDLNDEVIGVSGYVEDSEDQMKEVVLDSDDDARDEDRGIDLETGKRHRLSGCFSGRGISRFPLRQWLPSADIDNKYKETNPGFTNNAASMSPVEKRFQTDAKEFQEVDKDCVSKLYSKTDGNNDFGLEDDECKDIEFTECLPSQGTALEFVNYFISAGDFLLDNDEETGITETMRSPPSLSLKGTQSLAKRISSTFAANKFMAFEWSENQIEHHDHNAFRVRSSAKVGLDDGDSRGLSVNQGDEGVDVHKDLEGRAGSTVCGVDENSWMACGIDKMTLDLEPLIAYDSVDMDEHIDVDLPREIVCKGDASGFAADSLGIGMGTQIAIEAMEALKHSTPSISNATFSSLSSDKLSLDLPDTDNLRNVGISVLQFAAWSCKRKRSNRMKLSTRVSENTQLLVYSRRLKKTKRNGVGVFPSKLNSGSLLKVGTEKANRTLNSYQDEAAKMNACINPKTSSKNRAEQFSMRDIPLVYNRKRKTSLKGEETSLSPNLCDDPISSFEKDTPKQGFEVSRTRHLPLQRSPMMKELTRLGYSDIPEFLPRKRACKGKVCILFSQHMGTNLINRQKKIVSRLGLSIALCSNDATHFVADEFVRTRNMLEAIALGKPVVTHLWLEGCDQAGYVIEEKSYILRDEKKEKEIGFKLPASIARAKKNPLLKGKKVFITPNAKPSTYMIRILVSATQGQIIHSLEENINPESVLIISSQEDHTICLRFLEQGAAAMYSSELLFNGIVTQKLEYDRYRILSRT